MFPATLWNMSFSNIKKRKFIALHWCSSQSHNNTHSAPVITITRNTYREQEDVSFAIDISSTLCLWKCIPINHPFFIAGHLAVCANGYPLSLPASRTVQIKSLFCVSFSFSSCLSSWWYCSCFYNSWAATTKQKQNRKTKLLRGAIVSNAGIHGHPSKALIKFLSIKPSWIKSTKATALSVMCFLVTQNELRRMPLAAWIAYLHGKVCNILFSLSLFFAG